MINPIRKFLDNLFIKPKSQELFSGGLERLGQFGNISNSISNTFNSITYACLRLRADAISSLVFRFYNELSQNKKDELSIEHWLVKLFKNPNPLFRRTEFFRLMQYWLDYNGNVFIYSPKDERLNYPTQMWILQSPNISIKLGEYGVDYYKYNYEGTIYGFMPEDIIHIKNLIPGTTTKSEFLGQSVVSMALNLIESDNELNKFIKRDLLNDTIPPLIIESENDSNEQQMQLFKERWNSALPYHKLMGVLSKGLKVVPLIKNVGNMSSSMSTTEMNELITKKLAIIFGIPYSKLTGENTTFASAKISDFSFRADTIEPLAINFCESFSSFFSKKTNENLMIDYEEFNYIDEDIELKTKESNLKFGITTINEERQKIGLDPIQNGDIHLIQSNLVTLDNIILPKKQESQGLKILNNTNRHNIKSIEQDEVETNNYTEEQKKEYWEKWNKKLDEGTDKFQSSVAKMFKELSDIVFSNLNDGNKSYKTKELKVEELYSEKEFERLLSEYIDPTTNEILLTDISDALDDIRQSSDDIETEYNKQIKEATKYIVSKVKTVNDTLKSDLDKILMENKDASVDELTDLIDEEFAYYSNKGFKSKRIAQTSNTYIVSKSQKSVFKNYDVKYMWLSMRDGRVRQNHAKLDGTYPDEKGLFGGIVDQPGNFSNAGDNINCRCVLLPAIQ